MTEKVEGQESQTPVNPEPKNEEKQYSEIELQAMEQGWRPKDEYEGDPSKWVSAEIFVARAPLFEHIENQKRDIKQLKQALKEVAKNTAAIRKQEYDRALTALKAQKKEALLENDADAVIEIDEKISLVKEEQRNAEQEALREPVPDVPQRHPEFEAWAKRNSWYDTVDYMKAFADRVGRNLASAGKSPQEVLKLVEQQVREEFPHKFRNPARDQAPAVESSTPKASGGKSDDIESKMSPLEKRIMETVLRTGVSKEEYLKEYKKSMSGAQ